MGGSIVVALQLGLFLLIALGAFLVIARRDRRAKAGDRRRSSRGGRRKGEPASVSTPTDAPEAGAAAIGAAVDFRHREAQS
jgi:hypothetical protein